MRERIAELLNRLPNSPGVYLMKDAAGEVFYIGKAKKLHDRVRSYFSGSDERAFVSSLDSKLADLEVVLTNTEKEALILEDNLIKTHKPRCNVRLVDDKHYLSLRLDLRQTYPRIEVVRRFTDDGARYFGPYHSARSIRETLRLVNRHFQLRTCSDHTLTNRRQPCLQYQIKRCPAPCAFDLSGGAYRANVDATIAFLDGREDVLVADLDRRMREHSERLEFEQAAALRDQLRAVARSLERQRITSPDTVGRDVVGLYREGCEVEVHVLRSRQGRLTDAKRFSFSDIELSTRDALADFAVRYYRDQEDLPEEILFPEEMEWAEALGDLLFERAGRRVRVVVPQRGDKRQLVLLAAKNARQAFVDKERERGAAKTAIDRLQRALRLRRRPERIECFDISHLMGTEIVASSVRFELGVVRRDLFRHYNIKSLTDQNDFAAIYETTCRRARRGLEEGDLPDLIIIDGGKGQLNAARAALDDHGIDNVDLVGLAKAKTAGGKARLSEAQHRSPERVFVVGQKNPIVLRQDSSELFLLTRARDEAHRFAITHQRRRRRRAQTRSVLDRVAGVGPARRRALLKKFGSVACLAKASAEEVARVVGHELAARVLDAVRTNDH